MKGISFNLKDAKKVAGDRASSTFQLKDGHQIKIAHHSLPELQRKALQRLPLHLAEGTPDVEGQAEPTESDLTPVSPDNFQPVQPDPNATPIPVGDTPQIPGIQTPNMAAQPAEEPASTLPEASTNLPDQGAPVGSQTPSDTTPLPGFPDLNKYVDEGQRAIREQQVVSAGIAKSNADTEQEDLNARENLQSELQQNTKDFVGQQQQFMKDYMNNKINPRAYVENMSSGQKVATAIGLFLGGLSSPYTKQGNPALDFLNKQIDRDIEGQRSRLDQQKTLLGANQALYHDQVLAENATRAQMNDIYSHQIQLNADKLGNPAAKAKADAAAAQFGLQTAGLLQQNAIRATALHAMSQGGAGLDAQTLATAGFMSPEQAEKEQSSVNAQKTAVASTKDLFQRMNTEQTPSNLLNPQSYKRIDALNSELINTVMNASASKRLTREAIQNEIQPFELKTSDTPETRTAKLDSVLNVIGKHADPTPMMSKYAPKALPQYPYQRATQAPQYTVGQVLRNGGQKVQIINSKGDFQPVK